MLLNVPWKTNFDLKILPTLFKYVVSFILQVKLFIFSEVVMLLFMQLYLSV